MAKPSEKYGRAIEASRVVSALPGPIRLPDESTPLDDHDSMRRMVIASHRMRHYWRDRHGVIHSL